MIDMVHKGSAVIGAGATVAVGLGVFFAVSASNADELDQPPVTPVGHYSTTESQDPIEYVPEPEPIPAPEPVVEEPVVSEPAPVVEPEPQPAPEPEPAPVVDGPGVAPPGTIGEPPSTPPDPVMPQEP